MTLPEAAVGECGVGAHLTLEHLVVVQLEVLEVVLTPHVVPEPQPEPELARAQVAPVHGQLLDVHRQRPVDDGLDFLHNAFFETFSATVNPCRNSGSNTYPGFSWCTFSARANAENWSCAIFFG